MKRSLLAGGVWNNPVIVKDVRTRMRGIKTFVLITAHLAFLTIALAATYLIFRTSLTSTGNLEERRVFGKAIFGLLVFLELIMVSFVAPALTSGSISSERERQTFDLLRVTLLPARELVLGKYLPGLSFVLLLLLTSIPLQGPAFLIGGVLWQEIILATLILMTTAIAFCASGLLLSALIRRTLIATTVAYAISIFIVFGIPVIAVIILAITNAGLTDWINTISPLSLQSLILFGWILISCTPIGTIVGTEAILLDQGSLLLARLPLKDGIQLIMPSPWLLYVTFYLLFSLAALWLTDRLVQQADY